MRGCLDSMDDTPTPESEWTQTVRVRTGDLQRAFETGRASKLDDRDRAALRRTITGIEIGWLPIRVDGVNFTTDRVRSFRQGCGLMIETIIALAVAADNEIIGASIANKLPQPRKPGDLTNELVTRVVENAMDPWGRARPNTDPKYARSFNLFCNQLGLPPLLLRQRLIWSRMGRGVVTVDLGRPNER